MSNFKDKPYQTILVFLIVLGLFTCGLLGVNNLYSYLSRDSAVMVLEKSLFAGEESKEGDSPFAVDRIVKFTLPYTVLTYDLFDINTVALMYLNPQDKMFSLQTGIYNLNQGAITGDLGQKKQTAKGTIQVAPDGKTVLTSLYEKTDALTTVYIYDLASQRNIGVLHNLTAAAWLPAGRKFVGLDDYLFVYDITTGQREDICAISQYIRKPEQYFLSLNVLADGETVGVTGNNSQGSSDIILINLTKKTVKTNRVTGFLAASSPLAPQALAYVGSVQERDGLYAYNASSKAMTQLLDMGSGHKIGEISASPDGRKIAYTEATISSGTAIQAIHVASLNNQQLTDDQIVFQDSQLIQNLIWTKDSQVLYYLQNGEGSTILGRILFKNLR
ncbi:hypothetical protein [Desulfosporosinus sp. OT]|uniref:hypothetical protein n=1 Tax=Desulfosporosinus sp. OT TaxID=913865 RepID=UPI001A992E4C|nr:hypothetical protein [Desulfosporosinus sp. OT]